MEKLAKKIADSIGESFSYDSEKKAVIAYGLTAIFQMLMIFVIVSVLGLIGGFWIEGMLIFLLVGLMRKSTGGAHSSTFTGCMIFSIFFISLMAFLSHYLSNPHLIYLYAGFSALVFLWSFYTVYKKSPVASPKKPIIKPDKIARLRFNAFITLTVYLLLVSVFYIFSANHLRYSGFGLSITMAVLWQTFMLTQPGHKFMRIIDHKLVDF